MSLTTTNGKLAVMEWDQDYEPGLPISPGAFDQADQQQLLWGIPEVLWGEEVVIVSPHIFLQGNIQRTIFGSGNIQRAVALTGDRGANSQ